MMREVFSCAAIANVERLFFTNKNGDFPSSFLIYSLSYYFKLPCSLVLIARKLNDEMQKCGCRRDDRDVFLMLPSLLTNSFSLQKWDEFYFFFSHLIYLVVVYSRL